MEHQNSQYHFQIVSLGRDVDTLQQQLGQAHQELDQHSRLGERGFASQRDRYTSSTNYNIGVSGSSKSLHTDPKKHAWGQESNGYRSSGINLNNGYHRTDDKDRMIEELRTEVRRVKDKYYDLKSSRSPYKTPSSSHHHHHSSHRKSKYGLNPMVISDIDGNVVMDPNNLERVVEELQHKVKKIKQQLPEYM